jgi:hypothetical protein
MAKLFVTFVLLCGAPICVGQSREAIEKTELGNLQNYYATQDPHYVNVVAQLPNVQRLLNDLKTGVTAAQAARPEQFEAEFSNCLRAIDVALRRTNSAIQSTEQPQYGNIRALVFIPGEDDENRLPKVLACIESLNSSLGRDPALSQNAARLQAVSQNIQEEFDLIDLAETRRKAKAALRRVVAEKAEAAEPLAGSCENINLEQLNFTVRSIRIDDPFYFLPWVKARQRRAADQINALVKGKPFNYTDAAAKALNIIENENFLPDTSDQRVKLRLEIVSVENCSDQQVDLVYRIYSTQIMPVLSARPEEHVKERETPQTPAGQTTVVAKEASPFHFSPLGGYDSTDLLFGGGRFEIRPREFLGLPFKSAIIKGVASPRMHNVTGALDGAYDSQIESGSWLAHAEWLINFTHYDLPTGLGNIKGGHLAAHFSGVTKPLAGGNVTLRFGASLEGGNRQGDAGALLLAPDTIRNAGFGTLKLYGAIDSRLKRNILTASYGLELGSVGPAARIDWRKHILDARHQFWYPVGNHHLLDLESQFTLGRLELPGTVPLAERFFGGTNEEFLIATEAWQIRANPVIRAIPASKFFQTSEGAGARSFFSYNLTVAYGIWRKTLVPEDLTSDPDFTSELDGAITTVTSTLQNYYASKNPHYEKVVSQLPAAQAALTDLKNAVAAAQPSHPNLPNQFKACTKAVNGGLRRITSAIAPQGSDQYGLLASVLSDDPDEIQLIKVNQACGAGLNASLQDAAIGAASTRVETLRVSMTAEFNQIDQASAGGRAKADMAFTRRTLNTLFNDVNIYSVSPVVIMDIAGIGPRSGSLGGTRYGPGAGIRLELASVAHFTVGYAWNVKQGPGEGRGNVFFRIGIRDLFH